MKRPERLIVEMTLPYPRWVCSVSDGKGTANGGFLKRFQTHDKMLAWLKKYGYAPVLLTNLVPAR